MPKQLCLKLLSRISNTTYTNSISRFSSSFLKNNANPFHQHDFSQYSTLSRSHLWKLCSNKGVQNGGFSSPVLGRRYFSNAILKGFRNFHGNGTVVAQCRRKLHSFNSQYSGWRSIFRGLPHATPDGVVLGLIITNVAVFLLWKFASTEFMVKNFMISVNNVTSGRLHTLITSAFSHKDTIHLISNMIGLYFFGTSIGRTFGAEYLLKLYLCGAIAGSVYFVVYHAFIAPFQTSQMLGAHPSKIPGLGASGAVNAIMLLDIFLFPKKTIYFDFIIPVPAILMGIFIIGKDLSRILEGDREVSGSAHLGGATVAALAWMRSRRGRFRRF